MQTEKPVSVRPLHVGKTGALLATYEDGRKAIVKLSKPALPNGKAMQRGIPTMSHPHREVAFYQLAKLLGFEELVPETVLTEKVHDGVVASAQQFVPAVHLRTLQPKLYETSRGDWYTLLKDMALHVPKKYWRRLVVLDIIAGVRDRHANNVGVLLFLAGRKPMYRLVAWDNAVSFGMTFDKYHNVFHKLLFRTSINLKDIWPVLDGLSHAAFTQALGGFLAADEIADAFLRMQFIREFPYRLPWRVMSGNHDGVNDFPAYLDFFQPFVEPPMSLIVGTRA